MTTKLISLFAALAFVLPMAALVSAPSMAATHKKPHHVLHRHVHKAATHHRVTHHKPRPRHLAVH